MPNIHWFELHSGSKCKYLLFFLYGNISNMFKIRFKSIGHTKQVIQRVTLSPNDNDMIDNE